LCVTVSKTNFLSGRAGRFSCHERFFYRSRIALAPCRYAGRSPRYIMNVLFTRLRRLPSCPSVHRLLVPLFNAFSSFTGCLPARSQRPDSCAYRMPNLSIGAMVCAFVIWGLSAGHLYLWNRKHYMIKSGLSFAGVIAALVPFIFWQIHRKKPQPVHLYVYLSALVEPSVYGLIIEVCIILLGIIRD
jgi:hypothetical protein